jgi:diaminopimelate epimerase
MDVKFSKYQGSGNDFILIDNRTLHLQLDQSTVAGLCHRKFGIGADGLMLLELTPGADYRMVYFNSDGNLSSLCGNGSRCMAAFAHQLNVIGHQAKFLAADGLHDIIIHNDTTISLKMADIRHVEIGADYFYLNTGSPHYVKVVEDVHQIDVVAEGRTIRYNERFKEDGTNVNFISVKEDQVFIRTYERGVEDETLSCGTGATACAIVAALTGIAGRNQCELHTMGGLLKVSYEKVLESNFYNIWLTGPALEVFTGVVQIQ